MVRFIDAWADDGFSVQASYGGPMIEHGADGTRTVVGRGTDWMEIYQAAYDRFAGN